MKNRQQSLLDSSIMKISNWYYFGLVMQLGLVIIACVLIGLGMGLFLDKFFKTNGVFLVIFLIMGIIAGFKNVYTEIMKDKK